MKLPHEKSTHFSKAKVELLYSSTRAQTNEVTTMELPKAIRMPAIRGAALDRPTINRVKPMSDHPLNSFYILMKIDVSIKDPHWRVIPHCEARNSVNNAIKPPDISRAEKALLSAISEARTIADTGYINDHFGVFWVCPPGEIHQVAEYTGTKTSD